MTSNAVRGIGQREFSSTVNVTSEESRRLWRHKGKVVVANLLGELRYLYEDGSFDEKSIVDPRVNNISTIIRNDLVAVIDWKLPGFAEDWRQSRISEALKNGHSEVLKALGAKILIFDQAPPSDKPTAETSELLPPLTKSNIIALSLPETATGKNLENVA